MRFTFTVLLVLFSAIKVFSEVNSGITGGDARKIVNNFYNALKKSTSTDVDNFYDFMDSYVYPYIIDKDALQLPNDFHPLAFQTTQPEDKSKRIVTYIGDIMKFSRENRLSIDYAIRDIIDLSEINFKDNKESSVMTYWELIVDKSFSINGKKYVFSDTVDVKVHNGKIALISNKIFREASPKPKKGSKKEIEAWHNEMTARAARYWNQGRKKEAFDAYLKSVEDFDDADVYFRIGVLLLKHHKKCTNYSKRKARDLAYSYFSKAEKFGHPEAPRVIYWYWGENNDIM